MTALTEATVDDATATRAMRVRLRSAGVLIDAKGDGERDSALQYWLAYAGWTIGIKQHDGGSIAVGITKGERYAEGTGRSIFLAAARATLQSLGVRE